MAELSLVVTVQLTEAQRAAAIRFSGTNGGDGNSTFLQLPKGALKDLEELEKAMQRMHLSLLRYPTQYCQMLHLLSFHMARAP